MPDAPRPDVLVEWPDDSKPIGGVAHQCDKSEQCRSQAFVAVVHAESEWLQHIEYRPDGHSIDDAVSQPAPALLKRIYSGKECSVHIIAIIDDRGRQR